MSFTHLHVHTEYSLLDGLAGVKELVREAKEQGMESLAITDHGNMFGVVDFYNAAKDAGIHPVLGCEVYTAARGMEDHDFAHDRFSGHLVLLAETNEGYKNLMKLVSEGYMRGFYFKPRVDKELLRKHSKGLIALSACLAGDVPRKLLKNWDPESGESAHAQIGDSEEDYEAAKAEALEYLDIFGEGNFFLELQDHGIEEEAFVKEPLKRISRETGIPLVVTNDIHYLKREHAKAHDVLLCIQTGKKLSDEKRMRFSGDQFYFRTEEEMRRALPDEDLADAFGRTAEIARRCNVEIDFSGRHLPDFTAPDGKTNAAYLRELCEEGLRFRYGDAWEQCKPRLDHELAIIEKMGFVEYFLIVWDFIKYARDAGIPVGPGRGSAAGSIVAYTLRITDIDPLAYNLIFERFLNPERVSMPDIDIDFCDERRGEVIDYVIEKYGEKNVAQIITFGTMKAKAVVRDVGRVLDMPLDYVDRIAKLIPNDLGITIEEALRAEPKLAQMIASDEQVKQLFDFARVLEGKSRHAGTHAAGVVITKGATDEYVPLFASKNGVATQFTMTTVERLGLLKMDFLGLRNLSVIDDTIKMVEKNHGVLIDFAQMAMDDPAAYDVIAAGDTDGVFQLENPGMRDFMKKMRPRTFEDITVGIALYRPGPMARIPDYLKNRNQPDKIKYDAPELKPILDVTYGVMVYQEQVMQIVRDLAGYDYGRSDEVRRAMSKKKESEMLKQRDYFIHGIHGDPGGRDVPGCIANGISEKAANKIFDDMIDFASYAFNKSHAAAYAVVAYRTAYLKAHYPTEFMAALMSSFMGGDGSKIAQYIRNCKEIGIEVLPPDVLQSERKFSVEDGRIRMGMRSVKNCGDGAIEAIIEWRESGAPARGIRDFVDGVDQGRVNSRAIESLIYAGAFDSIQPNRASALRMAKLFGEQKKKEQGRIMEGQASLFDMLEADTRGSEEQYIGPDFDMATKLALEKEVLGIYFSGHPLDDYAGVIEKVKGGTSGFLTTEELNHPEDFPQRNPDTDAIMVGQITSTKVFATKKTGKMMATMLVEDFVGTAEVIVFTRAYEKTGEGVIREGAIVVVRGKAEHRVDEAARIIATKVTPIESVADFYERQKQKVS
ncbi:MAG: DNA polymerase III subunit alpha [Clostridiales Family XIII bacterium]|jgi:DNA polymerase-3 subunit alpha|nr:DNA polymerase III subunit alpha [Clostridiales Family XIII bacterium]